LELQLFLYILFDIQKYLIEDLNIVIFFPPILIIANIAFVSVKNKTSAE
jgi:hypothetical protein